MLKTRPDRTIGMNLCLAFVNVSTDIFRLVQTNRLECVSFIYKH